MLLTNNNYIFSSYCGEFFALYYTTNHKSRGKEFTNIALIHNKALYRLYLVTETWFTGLTTFDSSYGQQYIYMIDPLGHLNTSCRPEAIYQLTAAWFMGLATFASSYDQQ